MAKINPPPAYTSKQFGRPISDSTTATKNINKEADNVTLFNAMIARAKLHRNKYNK